METTGALENNLVAPSHARGPLPTFLLSLGDFLKPSLLRAAKKAECFLDFTEESIPPTETQDKAEFEAVCERVQIHPHNFSETSSQVSFSQTMRNSVLFPTHFYSPHARASAHTHTHTHTLPRTHFRIFSFSLLQSLLPPPPPPPRHLLSQQEYTRTRGLPATGTSFSEGAVNADLTTKSVLP